MSSDEKLREDRPCTSLESAQANKNKTLHQEVTDQAADQSDAQTHDVAAAKDLLDKEYFCGLGLTGQMQEDHRSSDGDSAEGGSVPEEEEDDEEDKEEVEEQDYEEDDKGDNEDKEEDCEEKIGGRGEEGDFLMSTCCSGDFCDGWKEDRTLSEGQPLTLEGSRNPQDRNEEQEGDSDEDLSYFERVPGLSSATRIKGDGADGGEQEQEEGKQEDLSGSENEDVITEEGRAPTLCFDQEEDEINMDTGFELVAKVDLECPDNDLASQNLQGLTADGEAVVGKIRDFVGEEHQEAGESFADYPSDFSSSEYEESGSKSPTGAPWENIWVVRDGGDLRSEEGAKGDNEGEEKVDSMLRLGSERSGEGVSEEDEEDELEEDEVEDEEEEDKREEELEDEEEQEEEQKEQEEDEGVGELLEHELGDAAAIRCELGESDSYSSSEDEASLSRSEEEFADGHLQPEEELRDLSGGLSNTYTKWSSSEESTGFDQSWNPDTLTLQSRPAESQELCTTSVGPTWPAVIKGSVDDSFFFNTEAPGTTAAGELEEEEYEEERNWEQEQERIKAFFEFYDSSDGEKSEGESLRG